MFIIAVMAIVAAIGAGLAVVGPPADARMERNDWVRLRDLQNLASLIDCGDGGLDLPETLEGYQFCGFTATAPRDPLTDAPYKYSKLDHDTFEVCATFETLKEQKQDRFGRSEMLRRDGKTGCLRFTRKSFGASWGPI